MKIECVYYFPKFLDNEFATKACEKFRKDFVWSENTKTNRAQVLYGDEGVDYKYHMMANKEIFKWDPLILEIKSKTEELYFKLTNKKVIFNVMLANYYKDGLSNIGWHADREEVETKKKKNSFLKNKINLNLNQLDREINTYRFHQPWNNQKIQNKSQRLTIKTK